MAIFLEAVFIAFCLLGAHQAARARYITVSLTLIALTVGTALNLLVDHTSVGHHLLAGILGA